MIKNSQMEFKLRKWRYVVLHFTDLVQWLYIQLGFLVIIKSLLILVMKNSGILKTISLINRLTIDTCIHKMYLATANKLHATISAMRSSLVLAAGHFYLQQWTL